MDQLSGTVDRVTFYNEENFYTVAKFKTEDHKLVTVVGNLPPLYAGEDLLLKGEWITHKDYGNQFRIEEWLNIEPHTLLGIERFLGSGLLKGVGPATAKKIVKQFGTRSLEVIRNSPEELIALPGFSSVKADRIADSLREQGAIERIMVFLQGVGVSPGYALKIFHTYHDQAIQVVKENPYRLADDVFGIGFKVADEIARKMGIAVDSPHRIQAGIRYLLNENSENGHIYALEKEFLAQAQNELGVNELQLTTELEQLIVKKDIFREVRADGERLLYLASFYYSELGVAVKIKELIETGAPVLQLDVDSLLEKFSRANQISLADNQREAIEQALRNSMLIITGGPGTGKTTIVKAILHLLKAAGLRVMLAAPTGRAAKRLAETTGEDASTIHRLLGYGNGEFGDNRFQYDENEPLDTEALIIDEFSMVDLVLFYHLLKAIKPGTRLILVGDVDQLPSVGPGSVLRDLIGSERLPAVRLNVIFRQAKESLIITNAHRINRGEYPIFANDRDFFFIEENDPERIVKLIPELVGTRLPRYLNCDPVEDIQVLSPMRRTITGVGNLNLCLQEALNPATPDKPELRAGSLLFRLGDKVMQIKNDYQRQVFNGDIGRIRQLDSEDHRLVVGFPEVGGERSVAYESENLDQLVLSYAISVHKSQGNEYPVVVMPVTTQHFLMLQRNLFYTAITRARRLVVLAGTKKAIVLAVKNNKIEERHSLLQERLRQLQ